MKGNLIFNLRHFSYQCAFSFQVNHRDPALTQHSWRYGQVATIVVPIEEGRIVFIDMIYGTSGTPIDRDCLGAHFVLQKWWLADFVLLVKVTTMRSSLLLVLIVFVEYYSSSCSECFDFLFFVIFFSQRWVIFLLEDEVFLIGCCFACCGQCPGFVSSSPPLSVGHEWILAYNSHTRLETDYWCLVFILLLMYEHTVQHVCMFKK